MFGFGLVSLILWRFDEDSYLMGTAREKIVQGLVAGFLPGFVVFFAFAAIIENINIRSRREFMQKIRIHGPSGGKSGSNEVDLDYLVEPVPFTTLDVTVVVPVYEPPPAFKTNIASLAENGPAKICIIADITCVDKIRAIVDTLESGQELIEVIPESLPGKRAALSTGLRAVTTRLTCFVDDEAC